MALFHLLLSLKVSFGAVYFRHDSPGEFPERSGNFCAQLCSDHGVRFHLVEVEARALQEQGDLSWEAAARQLRYQHLRSLKGLVMTAHTADDQAETVLLRLLDGSALAGLAGIRERTERLLRPLLSFRRQALREFLRENQFCWLEDPTNQGGNDRARLRQNWLPRLEEEHPSLIPKLGRTARRLAQDEDFLSRLARDWLRSHHREGDSWPLGPLSQLSGALRYRVLREIWRENSEPFRRPLGSLFEEAERLLHAGADDRRVEFAGGRLRRLGEWLWLEPELDPAPWGPVPLAFEGRLEGGFWSLGSEPSEKPGALFCDIAPPPEGSRLELRSRRPGDRFKGKELKKLLAETGHPPWVRDRWPLLVSGDEVVAVPRQPEGTELAGSNSRLRFWPYRLRAGQKEELSSAAEKDY